MQRFKQKLAAKDKKAFFKQKCQSTNEVRSVGSNSTLSAFAAMAKLRRDTTVADGFIIQEKSSILGEGSSAIVRKAKNSHTGETAAVKIIRTPDEEYSRIVKKEFELLEPVCHPNIVRVYELRHNLIKQQVQIFMELCRGQTLS